MSCSHVRASERRTFPQTGHLANGYGRDRLWAHREARRYGRGRSGVHLEKVRRRARQISRCTYRRNGRCRCRNQP